MSQLSRTCLISPLSAFEALRSLTFNWDPVDAPQVSRLLEMVLEWKAKAASEEDLHMLSRAVTSGQREKGWRSKASDPLFGKHETLHPALIDSALQRFFVWAASDGFKEIHPIEQAVLCQLRLMEICPLERFSHVIAQIFSYRFLTGSGWLFPLWLDSDLPEYEEAVLEALEFSTARLVQLHIEGCLRACRKCLSG